MSGLDPYRLWVEFKLKDETFSGFAQLKRSISSSVEGVAALKKELADVRANSLIPQSAITARAEMLRLAKEEAGLREKMALTTDEAERKVLATRLNALEIAQRDLSLKRQSLSMDEQAAAAQERAAAAAARRAAANTRAAWGAVDSGFNRAGHAGTNMMWTGGGILAGVAYATQQAINFDQATLETDLALGGYARSASVRDAQMKALQQAAMRGSEATGFFSAQDVMEGFKTVASAGMRPLVEKYGMHFFTDIAPALAQYMDVVGRIKGEDAATAAKQAIQIAHMSGSYTPQEIARTLNATAALSLAMPDSMSKAVSTLGYAMPSGKYLAGMSTEAVMAMFATADQSGLGQGRAGARLKNYIEAITTTQSKAREAAKARLGIGAAMDAQGNLDLDKSFQILIADRERMGEKAYRDAARTAFGAQGNIVAAMFGDPSKIQMYRANQSVIQNAVAHGDLQAIQDLLKNNIAGKEAQSLARLKNDIIEFGKAGLPIATQFFETINPELKKFGDWMDSHPEELKTFVSDAVHVGEELLIVGGSLKAISLAYGGVKVVGEVANGIRALKVAATGAELGTQLPAAASGIRVLGFALGRLSLPLAAVLASIKEFKDIKDMIDRYKRGDRVTQSDYDGGLLSPAGYGENTPGSHTYIPAPFRAKPVTGGSLKGLNLGPQVNIHGDVNLNLPRGSTDAQGKAFLNWIINQGGSIGTTGTLPRATSVPVHGR